MGAASEETLADLLNASPGETEVEQAKIERRVVSTMAGLLRVALVPLVALITFASGVANLYLALKPLPPTRQRLIGGGLPLDFFRFPRSFTLLIGFALVISAINVYKRKRRAFQFALGLSTLSADTHLLKGHDTGQALFSLALALVLCWARRNFTVRSSLPNWRSIALRIGVAVFAACGYGVAGFWLLDEREFGINFNWRASIHQSSIGL